MERKAHLVLIPPPGSVGHIVPMVEFGKRLLDRDDRLFITLLVMKRQNAPSLEAFLSTLSAYQLRFRFLVLPEVDPPAVDASRSIEKYATAYIENYKTHVKDAIVNLCKESKSPLVGVVVDLFCTSMIDVAEELQLSSYLFFASSVAFLSFMMLYLPLRHDAVAREFQQSDPDATIPGYTSPVPTSVLPSFVFNKDGGYSSMVNHGRKFKQSKGIIVNSFLELESYAVLSYLKEPAPPIYTIGPVIAPKDGGPQRDEIMKWLDDQPEASVVFLCFGSIMSLKEAQVKEIALGLERSGQRFLWSIRKRPSSDSELATNDFREILPHRFLERTKERGMVCGWAPQVEVLAHKATGGFVSHCGWNSTLESLWNGVPIAAWPMYAEQQTNAFQLVKDLGLAVEIRLDYRIEGEELVVADEIEKTIRCLMTSGDSDVRRKVKEMSQKSRQAVIAGGSSFISLGKLIDVFLGNRS